MDYHLGGITRKVTLMALPRQSVTDLRITTDLDEQYRNATLSVHTGIVNQSGQAQSGLQLRLYIDGLPNHTLIDVPALAAGKGEAIEGSLRLRCVSEKDILRF